MNEPRPVLTVSEVLEVLPVARAGLYRLFRSGALPCRKLGGRTVVRRDDLEAFLAALPAAEFRRGANA